MYPRKYITVTHGIRGYFAVCVICDERGFQEPEQSGIGSYRTLEEACIEGRQWAQSEEIPFIYQPKEA